MVVVDATEAMTAWLAGLGRAELARVLANRPDVLHAPQPRNLTELGQRLGDSADSLVAVLRLLPVPGVQVVEAVLALGGSASVTELTELLSDEHGADGHTAQTSHWLNVLSEHAIVWLDAENQVRSAAALARVFPSPLGLGPALQTLLPETSVDTLRRILTKQGVVKPPTRRADVVAEISRVLTDPHRVRGLCDTAPTAVSQELVEWAREGQRGELGDEDDFGDGFDDDDDDDFDDDGRVGRAPSYDPAAYARRRAAAMWAIERGLVFGHSWSYGWLMPAEVSRALRGPGFRAPFTAVAPAVHVSTVDPAHRATQSAVAVSRFADLALALVDRFARTSLPALKSGGVGARELAKLGKALGGADAELRLVLELCAAAKVLEFAAGRWQLGSVSDDWRSLSPAERVATMLAAWWQLPHAATQSRDEDGKATPALAAPPCLGCQLARQNLILTAAELGEHEAGAPADVVRRALWRRPFVHVLPQDARDPFGSVFTEATILGVLAVGSLTDLGRALVAGDHEAVRELLSTTLPEANDRALFGPDLTVVVTGAPTARVSRLLDAAADRESRGGATVWRVTPGSVRRALDEGQSAAGLEYALAEIATSELPQSLRYLIADVGRRHGSLRVAAAVSIVRSDDEALLRQVCADRALRKLGLRLVAPTVLGADVDLETVLSALRAAGYLPMPELAAEPDTASSAAREQPTQRQAGPDGEQLAKVLQWRRPDRGGPASLDPDTLAARLLAQPVGPSIPASVTEKRLRAANRSLSTSEIQILAHAVDHSEPVVIVYQPESGNLNRRKIVPRELSSGAILAWCELRSDERWFRIDRIKSALVAIT
jgi:hypothetical protein